MNKKKLIALLLASVMSVSLLAGCGNDSGTSSTGGESNTSSSSTSSTSDNKTINVWSFTEEIPGAITRFKEMNPSFDWDINITVVSDQDGAYETALEQALLAGGANAPHLFTAEQAFVLKYTQGGFSGDLIPLKDLIPDFASKLAAADVAQYAVEVGTRNGDIVGLRFQETGSCLIYRRSLAIDTWGTDDPAEISKIVGPGWDKFLSAAEDLKAKGYSIVAGDGDVFKAAKDGAKQGWITNGKITIDPLREEFFDLAMALHENDYMNGSVDWQDNWYADMGGTGIRPVFSFLGPAWLINYVMVGNAGDTFGDWAITDSPVPFTWGGTWVMGTTHIDGDDKRAAVGQIIEWLTLDTTEDGFMYKFANGTLNDGVTGAKDTVASAVVMAKSDGTLEYLGGQNMYDYFIPAAAAAKSDNWIEYDRLINDWFADQVRQYYNGNKTKEQAIADFKQRITDELGFTE
ncbi:MAG: ABC transporter substrate-binding protein [Lachnospiraceae bacterium]|nr:ABC transporter substrate-binding protein [Lachnospiraceae bacterium]